LLDYLQSISSTELVFVGMMTHMCIDATVRATDFEFECTLISDATATRDLINGKM
jgi:nicotinamidase-related amidase